jgi:phospholipid/cholesterol/gamma-HCH transport system permease protein
VYRAVADRFYASLTAIGRTGQFMSDFLRSLRDVSVWAGLTAVQMRKIGVQSLPIALFISVFTGMVLALLASYTLTGAVPIYFVGTMVGKAIMIELAPVLVGLALAGRIGANIAAELGTMRVTEQVDALETLAYDPQSYLVVPRVLAATLMFPVVVALSMAVGIISGWLTALGLLDLSTVEFVKGLRLFYEFKDVWYGLVKSMSFGFVVALIGCIRGLHAEGGAEGVGSTTMRAVVMGSQAILVLDAFWAVVLL